jgi:hypothetical protein
VARGLTTPAIMPSMAAAHLDGLIPAEVKAALIEELEKHRRQERSGEIVVRLDCDRFGQCRVGRVQPAEIVGRSPAKDSRDSHLTRATP